MTESSLEMAAASHQRILRVTDADYSANSDETTWYRGDALPFSVRLVRTEEHLLKAVAVRAAAFLRHAPKFGQSLVAPEDADRKKGNVVFLAESKITGDPVGSIRIETNAEHRTELERLISLPEYFRGKSIAQVSRLGVVSSAQGTLVKHALFKAIYRYALATHIDHLIVAARSPVDREFIRLGFKEIFDEPTLIHFTTQGDKLLRVFGFDVTSAEREWLKGGHPLYPFMIKLHHPDIEIFSSVKGMWSTPRLPAVSSQGGSASVASCLPFPIV